MLASIAFYVLSVIAVISAFAVISVRNPVHSVLFLILTFFTSAGLFVLLGAEFLAMLLVVVYVGAVAVLFRCHDARCRLRRVEEGLPFVHAAGRADRTRAHG